MQTPGGGDLWQHIALLSQAVTTLILVQQAALQSQPSAPPAEEAASLHAQTTILVNQLEDLRKRIDDAAQELSQRASAQQATSSLLPELTVERINIVEPDGTRRMILSNQAIAPDPVLQGQVLKRPGGNPAGIIFYNEEGDECGGLVYGGKATEQGYEAGGAILFDQFRQDQTIGLLYQDTNGQRSAGFRVWERPDVLLTENIKGAARVFLGRDQDQTASLSLHDKEGKKRVQLMVEAEGYARLEFLDADGQVIAHLP